MTGFMVHLFNLFVILLLLSAVAFGQTPPVKNPTGIVFTCPDHDRDDQHELDIVSVKTGEVVATLLGGDPAPLANGDILVPLNVQPIAFGQYLVVVRAVAGAQKSANSPPSDLFERVPGSPSKGTLR